jgi:hypothetical protein
MPGEGPKINSLTPDAGNVIDKGSGEYEIFCPDCGHIITVTLVATAN